MFWRLWERILLVAAMASAGAIAQQPAQKTKTLPGGEECAVCHEAGRRTGKRQPGVPPPFDAAGLTSSPHAALECKSCHAALKGQELPHPEKLAPVDCGTCHGAEQAQYADSVHGKAAKTADPLAPNCKLCHGMHDVLASSNPRSRTATMNVPRLCGQCHHEGSPVQLTHDIPQEHILSNYTESIHGEGLFKK